MAPKISYSMRNVCIPVSVVLLTFLNCAWSQHDHGHDHVHHHGPHPVKIPEGPSPFVLTRQYLLLKELNNEDESATRISAERLEVLVHTLLDRVNCTERLGDSHGTSCQEDYKDTPPLTDIYSEFSVEKMFTERRDNIKKTTGIARPGTPYTDSLVRVDESLTKCANSITNQLFTIIGEKKQSGINEEQFKDIAIFLFHILSTVNLQHQCNNVNNSAGLDETVNIVLNTGGTADILRKDELEILLSVIDGFYIPQTKARCFDAASLFEDAVYDQETGASERELYEIASLVVVKLLEGDCIGKAQEVGPTTFLDAVIHGYSSNNYLSETELDNLMFKLSIGDHSDHNHSHADHGSHGHADHAHLDHAGHAHGHDHQHARRRKETGHAHNEHDHAHPGHGGHEIVHRTDNHTKNSATSLLKNKCFSAHELFDLYGLDHTVGIAKQDFSQVCPSLIQQIESGACRSSIEVNGTVGATLDVWLYGMLSVIVISCCSLMGGLILPWMSKDLYDKFVHTLVAMAVAVMSGDALIHLIPMAVGLHLHEPGGHEHDHNHGPLSPEFDYVWKCTAAMVTIYGFFLFEVLTGYLTGHVHSHDAPNDSPSSRSKGSKAMNPKCISYPLTVVSENENNSHATLEFGRQKDKTEQIENHAYESALTPEEITADEVGPNVIHVSGTRRVEQMKCEEPTKECEGSVCLKHGPLPIMVVLGDGLHNFGDGLAIAVAYLAGIGPGVSTSLAVFCHELPHELGDLAILLKSGVSMKWALFLNFLSALSCVLGLVVGNFIGVTLQARQWIFAVTAGTFLYVALADMLPHITRVRETSNPRVVFFLVNLGFLVGIGVILVIALYEDSIIVNI